jgi:hypothetical protein
MSVIRSGMHNGGSNRVLDLPASKHIRGEPWRMYC